MRAGRRNTGRNGKDGEKERREESKGEGREGGRRKKTECRKGEKRVGGRKSGEGVVRDKNHSACVPHAPSSTSSPSVPCIYSDLGFLSRNVQQFTFNYFIKNWKVEEEELNVLLKGGSCS